ncbi:MAG TPA: Nif11-like leader peptide family RiPP precursor [bacterium]|nr:Nif11-like leader peptide family RiPP precursor [bacterium]
MTDKNMEALLAALRDNRELREQLATAGSAEEFEQRATAAGFTVTAKDFFATTSDDLSDTELEQVAGGYTFPPTDWIYCDNPWTNAWCTLRC